MNRLYSSFLMFFCILLFSGSGLANDFDEEGAAFEDEMELEAIELVEKPNDIDEEDYMVFSLLDRPFYIAGELQFASEFKGDYELDQKAKDDLLETEPAIKAELYYLLSENTAIFFENEVQYKSEYYSEIGKTDNQWIYEPTEIWIFFDDINESGVSFQAGRQSYEDDRQWWWDEQLDSIRLHYDRQDFHGEIAVAQQLFRESTEESRIDPEDKNIFRIISHAAWSQDDPLRFDLFGLYQEDHSSQFMSGDLIRPHDEDERDADLFWYGARVSGDVEAEDLGEFSYWLDAAGVIGDEKLFEFEEAEDVTDYNEVTEIIKRDVAGWGYDIGLSWNTGIFRDMTFTLGYAWGAGDRDPEDKTDRSFRQTGFNEGDKRFQYYGELLNPDLSNLGIFTVAIGFEIGESSTIDFIYHQYRQDYAADFLWESDLEAEPEGVSKDIGEEFDVALTFEEWDDFEIESSAALFTAGDAFGILSGETAYRLKFEINYLF